MAGVRTCPAINTKTLLGACFPPLRAAPPRQTGRSQPVLFSSIQDPNSPFCGGALSLPPPEKCQLLVSAMLNLRVVAGATS